MAIEHARAQAVQKPWGSTDLRPWSDIRPAGTAIGEVWFQRAMDHAIEPALLLKILFTEAMLSIQVHPDDTYARSIGLANGKNEAWYILAALPGARIALGLNRQVSPSELRAAIMDGSIAALVNWRPVEKDDVVVVPAGTIHAIGAGLVVAEIQQRSDTTFRLFDHGRARELHVDQAVGAAQMGPARVQVASRSLGDARSLLVAGPHFVLERTKLPPNSTWTLRVKAETWALVIEGQVRIGSLDAGVGDAVFLDAEDTGIEAGPQGARCLLAYAGDKPCEDLLCRAEARESDPAFPETALLPPHVRALLVPSKQTTGAHA